jgi:hypothetical protein
MEKFVIEDRGGESGTLGLVLGFFRADDPSLAENIAVLLAGDLFRHLEDHFNQGIDRQRRSALEEHAGLADVLDGAFRPQAQILDAITHRKIELEPASARDPGRFLFPGAATGCTWFGRDLHALSTPHRRPVVLVLGGAQQTNLVIVTVGSAPGPGEFVGATAKHENIHELLRHIDFRTNDPSDTFMM